MSVPALLHLGPEERGRIWREVLIEQVPGLQVRQWPDVGDPAEIGYLAAWTLPDGILDGLPNLRFVQSVGAGVDQLDLTKIPAELPLLRMIDPALAQGMTEFVVAHVLALHREFHHYRASPADGRWSPRPQVHASRRRVGIMGLGNMGQAVCDGLAPFGFQMSGWSRSRRALPGITRYSGEAELPAFLRDLDILVCLLPLTAATRGILNGELFARMPEGAAIINVGRGGHLVEDDLLAGLDSGRIGRAVLDVCETEPLPSSSPMWRHPAIDLFPHVASATNPRTSAVHVANAINADLGGRELPGRVDRGQSY